MPARPLVARRGLGAASAALALAALVACTVSPDEASAPAAPPSPVDDPHQASDVLIKVAPTVLEAVSRGEARDVLALYDEASMVPALGVQTLRGPEGAEVKAAAYAAISDDLLTVLKPAAAGALTLKKAYRYSPVLHLSVRSREALVALAGHPGILRVYEDERFETTLTESLPLVNQPAAAAAGALGAGTAVAVLDTGVDYTRAAFGACASAGAAGCKVAFARDFAPEDGSPDANGHGTNVAGIVLGVAPQTKILALDVFTGGSAYSNVILSAIDWVIANKAQYGIVALNMSLGGQTLYSSPCATDVFAAGVANARAAGILSAIASGNSASSTGISSPACVPAAVSVGAVYDSNVGGLSFSACSDATTAADKVTCFSNSSPYVTLLAPGAFIDAAGIRMSGTSQATPHVAGAIAALRSVFPSETPDETVARLVGYGKTVRDARNGVDKPRIDLAAALGPCFVTVPGTAYAVSTDAGSLDLAVTAGASCAWSASSSAAWLTVRAPASRQGSSTLTVDFETNPDATTARVATLTVGGKTVTITQGADKSGPAGSVAINAGDAATRSRTVTLTLAATDPRGVASMCISSGTTCSTWQPYATTKTFTLSGQGTVTVRAWFKDGLGNVGGPFSDTILLDTVAPTNGRIAATPTDAGAIVTFSGFADATSGVASYVVARALGTVPTSCFVGSRAYSGSATTFTDRGLTNGTLYYYRVCALDGLGNASTGVTATVLPRPEMVGPTGTVVIGGPALTRSTSVDLTLTASDPSGVASMCLSASATCTAWQPFATTKTWSLSREGENVVYATFRDSWTNVGAATSAAVTRDTTGPTNGSLTAARYGSDLFFVWQGARDANGVASFTLVSGTAVPTAKCATGAVESTFAAVCSPGVACGTSATWIRGVPSGTRYYRLCATDILGNVSTGVSVTAIMP